MPAAPAGIVEAGAPDFVVLGPEALGLSTVPFDLHLMPDGRVLVVSQNELAFGDGVRWEMFRAAPGQEPIFARVAVDRDGKLYTGVEGKLARIDLGADARWRYTPVSGLPQDQNVQSSTLISVKSVFDDWYWHGGSGMIVSWRPGQTARMVAHSASIEQIFTLGKDIYISEQSSGGLFRLAPGKTTLQRVEAAARLASETVTCAVPFAPGQLLVGTSFSGLRIFDGAKFRAFGETGLLNDGHKITDLCAAGEGRFAAAVDTVGIVFFDREGRAVQVVDRSLDHRLARVQRLKYTDDGVLWALLNNGVARVEFPSPASRFEPLVPSGLSFARPLRHAGRLWLLADGRAMRGIYTATGRFDRFEDDSPPGRYVFTLADVDGRLFATNDAGIFVREPTGWKLAVSGIVNARLGIAPTTAEGALYVARGEYGLLRITPEGYSARRTSVPELGDNYGAIQDAAGIVWLELGTSRVARVDPRPDRMKLQIFGTADGLTDGWVEMYVLEGVARFHLPSRLYRFDDAQNRFVEDRLLLNRMPVLATAGGRPFADRQGRLWYTADGTVKVIEQFSSPANSRTRTVPVGIAPSNYTVEDDGVAWLFESRRLVRLDLRVTPPPPRPLRAIITSVELTSSGRRLFAPGAALMPLEYSENSLVVHFAAPANPFSTPVTFEVQLEGADTQWVSTGTIASATFNRLKEGSYAFRVRPVTPTGHGAEARLEFTVRPPWFRTRLAWAIYVLSTIGIFAFVVWLTRFLQRREKKRLEHLVAIRTAELNTTNAQLGRQIAETTKKSAALSASEEQYRLLNAELDQRVQMRTAELSHSNEELQQRELLFRLIFEHAPVGISWKRADLGPNYHFNSTFRRILDLPADTLPDYSLVAAMVHPEDARQQANKAKLIETGWVNEYTVEQRYLRPDGATVWALLSVAVIRDQNDRIIQDIGILEDVTARKEAEQKFADTYKDLVEVSRTAGMAEVATSVLHNVGNVLNSLNVSAGLISAGLRQSKADSLARLAAMFREHAGDLSAFLTQDPKGQRVPEYIESLAQHTLGERDRLLGEITSLQQNVDHIKDIVAMQQTYATKISVIETLDAAPMMEDALRMNTGEADHPATQIVREIAIVPPVLAEKAKVVQILVNLIRNARIACDEGTGPDNVITVAIEPGEDNRVRFVVRDTGVGIPPENLTRIFAHGFTTRKNGHGFGLHAAANAAREMKGSLKVHSDGAGKGASFTLELPAAEIAAETVSAA